MAASVTTDFTAPYSAVETFVYDRIIADAVMKFANDFLDEFVQELPRGAKVLEVGCGGGQVAAELLQRRPDLELTGLDLADDQVARARKRCPDATFVQGSALELPFDDDHFDGVFSIASIKHWPDQRQGVNECVRVLRPGGRLIIAEADRACTLDEARNFVSNWHIPRLTRPIAMTLFRTFVAGQAIDPIEAQAHLESQPLTQTEVRRQPGLPSLAMIGVKAESA
jgi:ubiquinone/menaquinone biosynthesis C-methylase UbiE